MIQLTNLSKSYTKTKKAVDNLSLTISDGSITAFIGPNGAGKTTTLKMMTGILKPDQGEVLINSHSMKDNPIEAKKQFGFVSDNPDSFLRLRGIEYLHLMGDIYEVEFEKRIELIEHYSRRLGIYDTLNDKILSYSHGMRQKIMIVGALIHQPDILILDEPLTGLDPQSAYELKEIMREFSKERKTVLFSTHVLEVAERLCDKICIIHQGKVMYDGTLEVLKDQYPNTSLEEIFLKVTL
ncbi:MAG: ABC transporter ATP-binding protein [Erysipelothrix sp.]|jgi:ABC-2 type transport system ATP-binding protein|nr:ABC transporter ATP-binding protein [Erysipelothrix sp.]